VPTTRALQLSQPVAEILAQVEGVIASAAPFDPATSGRRFMIGAPDAVLTSGIMALLRCIESKAPNVSVGLLHLMPARRSGSAKSPWQGSLDRLEERVLDLAILPVNAVPHRFEARKLYNEDFVVAMRKGHPFGRTPNEAVFCRSRHLLVSLDGEPAGFVDQVLAKRGRSRRVVLTVPTFMMALAHLSKSDLIAALPRRLVERHAVQFGLTYIDLPFKRKPDSIQAVATKAALRDAGIAWLMETAGALFAPDRAARNSDMP
jgi:DNA-binding transcriptional LysR family regulator